MLGQAPAVAADAKDVIPGSEVVPVSDAIIEKKKNPSWMDHKSNSDDFWVWSALDDEDLNEEFINQLPGTRKKVGVVLNTGRFEISLCMVILFNAVVAILETDAIADGGDAPTWIVATNIALLVVYSIEILIRVFVYRMYYVRSPWNLLDLFVVLVDLFLNILKSAVGDVPNVSVLRTLRLIRLARAYRVIVLFPELHVMVMGLAGTIKTVIWGLILMNGFLIVFALVAVQLIHPVNREIDWEGCERCPRAFRTVWDASLTFLQQIIAGDSWGTVTLPIIEKAPWTVAFFLAVLVTLNLLVINLILAVVVDKAQQAHADDQLEVIKQQAAQKEEQHQKARTELIKTCYSMDEDESGCLTLPELLRGFDTDDYFASLLRSMDIEREDIEMVFNILDKDGSGDIDYAEFVDQLHKLKSQDTHTLLIFVLHHVKELEHMLQNGGARRSLMTPKASLNGKKEPERPAAVDIDTLGKMVRESEELFKTQQKLMQNISATFASIRKTA